MNKNEIYKNYSNEWYTPIKVLEIIERLYNFKFDFDPATTEEKAKEFGIKDFYTIETDGLKNEWKGDFVWINPPFTLKKEFLNKAREYLKINKNARVFILLPNSFSSRVYQEYVLGQGRIHLFDSRICFETLGEVKFNRPPFDSSVIELTNYECNEYKLINIKGKK